MSKWRLSLRVTQLCPWCSFNTETFCVLELYKSTATWSLLCVYIYIYFSYIKNSYLRGNKSEVPWNVVIGVMFSTHILKLSTMVVWRIIYNLAVHSYWSPFVLFFFLVGGGRDSNFFYYETIIYSGYLQSFMSMLMIFSSDESKRRT